MIKPHLGGRLATRAGQEEATSAPNLSSWTLTASTSSTWGKESRFKQRFLVPQALLTTEAKRRAILSTGIRAPRSSSLLEAPFSSFTSPNEGLQIKHHQRKLCSLPPLEKCTGKPGSFPQKPGVAPHFSAKGNTSAKPLTHTIPSLSPAFPSKGKGARNNPKRLTVD